MEKAHRGILEKIRDGPEGTKLRVEPELKVILPTHIELVEIGHSELHGHAAYAPLACGGYADIYKANMKEPDEKPRTVVVKVFRGAHMTWEGAPQKRDAYINRLRREYAIWASLKHENIIPLNGLVIHPHLSSPGLVSNFKENKDLHSFGQKQKCYDRLAMGRGVACGLEYLHRMKVVHGDLTMANVLVDQKKGKDDKVAFFPLITDFGKSRVLEKEGYTTKAGTQLHYQPPELIGYNGSENPTTKGILTCASDVYSFSLILLELITGVPPYSAEGHNPAVMPFMILKEGLRPEPVRYPVVDKSYEFCWPIMKECWKAEREERITSRAAYDLLCQGPQEGPALTPAKN